MIVQNTIRGFLDALYPPLCLLCGELSDGKYPNCCPGCSGSFEIIGNACCELCGQPVTDEKVKRPCLSCIRKKQPFMWCRSVLLYEGALAKALSRTKFGGDTGLFRPLGDAFVQGLSLLHPLPSVDLVVPVPLSWAGRWKRGFNQSYILATLAAGFLDLEIQPGILGRKGNRKQVGLGARERNRNAVASFVPGSGIEKARDRNVLLVDDVYTTGATVRACARILRRTDATVSVLTLARAGIGKVQTV